MAVLDDLRIAIEYMTLSVRRGNTRLFLVLLSEYEIEGTTYRANVFTISPGHVSDLMATDTGFRCLAMFPPDSLNPRDRRKGKRLKSGAVQVSFEAARTKINGIQVETSPGSSEFESLYE